MVLSLKPKLLKVGLVYSPTLAPTMSRKRTGAPDSQRTPPKKVRVSSGDAQDDSITGQKDPGIIPELTEGEVGIIEQVSLKNFMCHNRLDFKFGPNVNFVSGRNGSGKSAILTAIVIGLGGKATATSRGTAVKGFIKNGKGFAEVIIKMRNSGSDAYRPELYGNKIIIKRRLTADGGGSYKLESASGEVVSSKRDELANILDQFNIQVDNPVSILNQEVSRNFLHSKSPHDKYKFFLKATQLEQMERDYNEADEQHRIAKDILEKKEQGLPGIEKEVDSWKRKWRVHQSMDDLRGRLEHLKNEAGWAQVAELEMELDARSKLVTQQQKRCGKCKQKVEVCQTALKEESEKSKQAQGKLQAIHEKLEKFNQERTESRARLEEERKKYRTAQHEMRSLQSEMKSNERDQQALRKKIEELMGTTQKDVQRERHVRMEKIRQKEEERQDADAKRKMAQHHCDQVKNAVTSCQEQVYDLRQEEMTVKQQIEQKKRDLRNMEGGRNDNLRRFGHHVPELRNRINEAYERGRFKEKPRGPVGAHIKLKDPSLALPVEACLGGILRVFCVDNAQDERVLIELMKNVIQDGRRPPIITSKFIHQVHDIRKFAVRSDDYPSVMDVISVDDPVVANCLIDQRSVENILVIENNEVARTVMRCNVPPNCREAYTGVGDQIFPAPNYKYYSCTYGQPNLLQVSLDEVIKTARKEIDSLEQQLRTIHKQLDEQRIQCNNYNQQIRLSDVQITKLRQEINRLNLEITELKNIEEPEPIDVTTLEDELLHFSGRAKEFQETIINIQEVVQRCKATVEEIEKEFAEVEDKISNIISSKIDPLKEALQVADNKVEDAKSQLKYYEGQLKELTKVLTELEKRRESMQKRVEEDVARAERISPRVTTRRSAKVIDNEIIQITERLKIEEGKQGTKEDVTREYLEAKKRFEEITIDVRELRCFIENLHLVMDHRRSAYVNFRKLISVRVRFLFAMLLEQRNFNGHMKFDHERELLTIVVHPGKVADDNNTTDMRGLSGGERSFSTVCFILALWDAMESPFRILDEYDVFMDMVTRRISMDMMIDTALTKTAHQYFFLTPLGMNLRKSPKIRIFRMPDPDRNQTTLPFGNDGWTANNKEASDED